MSRTKKSVIGKIFNNQVTNSQRRKHNKPEYNLGELRVWVLSQSIFHELYDKWVNSGYDKKLKPSLDRTDDYQGYSLDRLKIMTWKENNNNGNADMRNGVNNKISTAVVQMTQGGKVVSNYYSQASACRKTGVNQSSIFACCSGKRKTAGGFKWCYQLLLK